MSESLVIYMRVGWYGVYEPKKSVHCSSGLVCVSRFTLVLRVVWFSRFVLVFCIPLVYPHSLALLRGYLPINIITFTTGYLYIAHDKTDRTS